METADLEETQVEEIIEEASEEAEEIVEEEVLDEEQHEGADQPEQEDVDDDESDMVEISLGDESLTSDEDEKTAPSWVKDLRKTHRETQKQNKELQKELAELKAKREESQAAPVMKEKPTLESFDYDSEKYEAALGDWMNQERKQEESRKAQEASQREQEAAWQKQVEFYEDSKQKLGVKDYDDAEHTASEVLDQTQQSVILQGSKNPALAFYAIGKNSKKAEELASIKDPVKFAFAIAQMEGQLKVNKRKASPKPEGKIASSGKKSATDSTLERLETEAAKTNDRTKVAAYKRKLRAKKR